MINCRSFIFNSNFILDLIKKNSASEVKALIKNNMGSRKIKCRLNKMVKQLQFEEKPSS